MKTVKTLFALICGLCLMSACATKEKVQGSNVAPAAQGKIVADKASGGNTDLTVKVKHLAKPERISAGATDYVVWVQPEGSNSFQNVGTLKVNKNLEGKYKTTIPFDKFRVLVTPEPNRMMSQPTGPAIFDQSVVR